METCEATAAYHMLAPAASSWQLVKVKSCRVAAVACYSDFHFDVTSNGTKHW